MASQPSSNQYADALQALVPSLSSTLKHHNRVMEEFTDDLYFLGLISIMTQTQLLADDDGERNALSILNWLIAYIKPVLTSQKSEVLRLFHHYLAEARARNIILRQRRLMGIVSE